MALLLAVSLVACTEGAPEGEEPPAPATAGGEGNPESATPLAITIDDLPWVGPLPPGWSRLHGTHRILEALEGHEAPATGFVNCGRGPADAPVLQAWMAAGHELGNHTAQHLDLNHADPAAWAADATDCHRFLTGYGIARWEGGVFLGFYAAYALYLVLDATAHQALDELGAAMTWFVLPLTALTLIVLAARAFRGSGGVSPTGEGG